MDLVGTCPQGFWSEWLAEGDAAGERPTGRAYAWNTRDPLAKRIKPGDRFYVVACGALRGWAPVVRVDYDPDTRMYYIIRRGNAVACTIPHVIRGFPGLRKRWWKRSEEHPFPDWRTP